MTDHPFRVRPWRRGDTCPWDGPFEARIVAETDERAVVGWAEIAHMPWQFHPRKYAMRLDVEPEHRGQGIAAALLHQVLGELTDRDALLVRANADERDRVSIDFLTGHDFREAWRLLNSSLDVTSFDPAPFAVAAARIGSTGITITALPAAIDHDPHALKRIYDLYVAGNAAQVELDPITPPPFEAWVASEVEGPSALPDAWFIAADGARFVGLSTLESGATSPPGVVDSGYTAVLPDYRGRGIAVALKLRTIEWARANGYRTIHTGSNSTNHAMLRINAWLGFVPEPARITFERTLANE